MVEGMFESCIGDNELSTLIENIEKVIEENKHCKTGYKIVEIS